MRQRANVGSFGLVLGHERGENCLSARAYFHRARGGFGSFGSWFLIKFKKSLYTVWAYSGELQRRTMKRLIDFFSMAKLPK